MPNRKTTLKPKPLYRQKPPKKSGGDFVHAEIIPASHFELRENGTIAAERRDEKRAPTLEFRDDERQLWIYHGNSLELLDAIAAKYPEGRFDAIFADPPYFLSNGGITCHAGKMVKVDKGDWDKSQGAKENHNFNLEWLKRCQKVLKPNGTIWIGVYVQPRTKGAGHGSTSRAFYMRTGLLAKVLELDGQKLKPWEILGS